MKSRFMTIVCIILLVLPVTRSAADRSARLTSEQARKAFELLKKSSVYYEYCAPCGDQTPRKVGINKLGFSGKGNVYTVKVNNRDIDPADIYVNVTGTWENLALRMGLDAPDAPRILDKSQLPEEIEAEKAMQPSDIPYLSRLEKDVVTEYNLARTNPKAYAKLMSGMRRYYNGSYRDIPGQVRLKTMEGVTALDEAVRFLEKASPAPPLTPSTGMSKAARDHVTDTGPKGVTGHTGRDGSSPFSRLNRHGKWKSSAGENISYGPTTGRDIVMQLIIDDGVKNRGHRNNIFNPEFKRIGVSYGPHKTFGNMCVQTLAGGYEEEK